MNALVALGGFALGTPVGWIASERLRSLSSGRAGTALAAFAAIAVAAESWVFSGHVAAAAACLAGVVFAYAAHVLVIRSIRRAARRATG